MSSKWKWISRYINIYNDIYIIYCLQMIVKILILIHEDNLSSHCWQTLMHTRWVHKVPRNTKLQKCATLYNNIWRSSSDCLYTGSPGSWFQLRLSKFIKLSWKIILTWVDKSIGLAITEIQLHNCRCPREGWEIF